MGEFIIGMTIGGTIGAFAMAILSGASMADDNFKNKMKLSYMDGSMGYRRLFIMRKDLHMSPGKLAAQVAHCAEAYWTHLIRETAKQIPGSSNGFYSYGGIIEKDIYEQYIAGAFVKTICEARNKNHLLKAKSMADELGLEENVDYGLIFDNCLTELIPEEEDGTTLTGIWFCPLPDEVSHKISKKFHLYM